MIFQKFNKYKFESNEILKQQHLITEKNREKQYKSHKSINPHILKQKNNNKNTDISYLYLQQNYKKQTLSVIDIVCIVVIETNQFVIVAWIWNNVVEEIVVI